jgi:hypothetical protein
MLELLFGVGEWDGFITSLSGTGLSIQDDGTFDIVVGRGQTYDPADNTSSTIIPPAFVGTSFIFSQRGVGKLRDDEISIAANVLSLTGGQKFATGDTYSFANKYASFSFNESSGNLRSIIANYVYFKWINDQEIVNVGIGTVKQKAENSTRVSGQPKALRAIMECRFGVESFLEFMQTNYSYPEYIRKNANRFYYDELAGINEANI